MITETSDPPTMVLMLTASDAPGERVTGLTLGADDYLAKPFHFPELVLRVRGLARRKPTAQPRVLCAWAIPSSTLLRRLVTRAGEKRDLSANEFAVLEALMRAAPAALSAEELLVQVWDEQADPFTKTVQVTLGRLRRKLGEPDIIETIRGVGYRVAP